jgi:D-aspartate ligase
MSYSQLAFMAELQPGSGVNRAHWEKYEFQAEGPDNYLIRRHCKPGIDHSQRHVCMVDAYTFELTVCVAEGTSGIDTRPLYELTQWRGPKDNTLAQLSLERLISEDSPVSVSASVVLRLPSGSPLTTVALRAGFRIAGRMEGRRPFRMADLHATWPVWSMPEAARNPALVLGRPNPNMLAQVRALGRCGIPVVCLLTRGETPLIARLSRYASRVIDAQHDGDEAIIAHVIDLSRKSAAKPVLFFGGDYDIALTARIWPRIDSLVLAASDPVASAELNDKSRQLALVRAAGVSIPEGKTLTAPTNIAAVWETLQFPVISKPVELARKGAFPGKIFISETAQDLERKLRPILEGGDSEVLIQEYIPGGDETLFFVLAACGEGGSPLAMVTGRKLYQYPAGLMCIGETVEDAELNNTATRAFEALGIAGVLGLEFKRDPRTGIYYYIEANFRPENIIAITAEAGVNLMLAAYLHTLGVTNLYRSMPQRRTQWRDISLVILSRLGKRKPKLGLEGRGESRRMVDALWATDDPLPAIAWYVNKIWRLIKARF